MQHLSKPLNIKNKANHCSAFTFGKDVSSIKMGSVGLTKTTSTYPSPAYLEQVSANIVAGNKPLDLNRDQQM